jgi:FkbM family methyltransferase
MAFEAHVEQMSKAAVWVRRFTKGRSLLAGRFRSLETLITPGVTIAIPLGAHRQYWAGPSQDRDLIEFLSHALPEDGLFLDIGANIGVYSAALWKLRGGGIRGAAFEPVPTTQELLQGTFRANGVPFSVEHAAVSDRRGTLRLTAYENGANNVWVKSDDGRRPTTEVPTISLDEWCGADPRRIPGAIKIDVEGHELAVLQGGRKTLRAHKPALVVECHAASWNELGVDRRAFDAEVRSIGYSRLCDRQGRPVDFLTASSTFHLLALA